MDQTLGGPAAPQTHLALLARLADVAVHVGLNLQAGQERAMTASVDALPLVRLVTDAAYRAGATVVTTFLSDDQQALSRFNYGRPETFAPPPLTTVLALLAQRPDETRPGLGKSGCPAEFMQRRRVCGGHEFQVTTASRARSLGGRPSSGQRPVTP